MTNVAEPPSTSHVQVLDLRGPANPPAVRRWTTRALRGRSDHLLGDVLLVVTELVTNAAEHGRNALRLRLLPGHPVRVEVDDTSPDQPILGHSSVGPTRGRGMVIVDAVSQRWGVSSRSFGKTVWADVA